MVIRGDPGWEHTMPRFYGVVAVVDANDRLIDFSLSSLQPGGKRPFSFPQPVIYPGWGYGGGVNRSAPRFPGALFQISACKRVHFPLGV